MIPLRSNWTATSRLYDNGKTLFTGRQKFSLDVGIAWQNYRDDEGIFQEIDLTPESSDIPGFDLMIRRAPYKAYLSLDGRRRIYPDRNDGSKYLEFPPSSLLAGRGFMAGSRKLLSERADYDVEIGWENSRVTFDTILHGPVPFDSITFPVVQNGISDEELKILLGKPQVRELNEDLSAISRDIDVSVRNGLVSLGFDLTGMRFPILIDPTLDLQVAADADDVRHGSGHGISQSLLIAGHITITRDSAVRFLGVNIEQADTIDVAFLTLTPDTDASNTVVKTNIQAHDDDNSGQVADDTDWHDVVDANLTTASIAWDGMGAWTKDVEEDSPSIVDVIQEVIDRSGWLTGNALHLFWLDDVSDTSAHRRAYQYDNDTSKAAKIHIEFSAGGGGGPADWSKRRRRRVQLYN